MLTKIFITTIALLSFNCFSAFKLQSGDSYKINYESGYAGVTCYGQPRYLKGHKPNLGTSERKTTHHQVFCQREYYTPTSSSRAIYTGDNMDLISKIKIENIDTSKSKTKKFYPDKKYSKRFNLLIRTLFQRPLLIEGENNLSISALDKDGDILATNSLQVSVGFSEARCSYRSMLSHNPKDCLGYNICSRYFYETTCR